MANNPPPPPHVVASPPITPPPRPEKRPIPPAFSSPSTTRFSPQKPMDSNPKDHPTQPAFSSPITRFSPQKPLDLNPKDQPIPHSLPSSATRFSPQNPIDSDLKDQPSSSMRSPYDNHKNPQDPSFLTPPRSSSETVPMTYRTSGKTDSPISQFNSPPAPPVFSSPLRPAAAPFSPSPALPQPRALLSSFNFAGSGGPSLPTSSLPIHSNGGTTELQTDALVNSNDSVLSGASPHVLFSAHKVLKQKKLGSIPSLGFSALVSPGGESPLGSSQTVQHAPHRCVNCGAYINLYSSIVPSSGEWKCIFCKNLNSSNGEYRAASREDLKNWPELSSPTVDYIDTGNKRPGFIPVSDSRMSAPIFLVIDESLDEAVLQHLQSSLHAFVDSLHPTTRIGVISYGKTVSVYDFSEASVASADLLPGNKSPTQDSLKALLYGTGIYLSPVHASLPVAHTIFSSLRPYNHNLPEVSRDRCLGTAVEVALAIIRGPTAEIPRGSVKRSGGNCRILVCAGGPNTYGPGSVPHSFGHPNYPYMEKRALKWMEHLGREARLCDTVVDILCAGTCPVRTQVLQPLAKSSGGVLVLHDDFGEAFGVNLQRASMRASGSHGMFEIRCSDGILVSRVIGPGEEAPSDAIETFKDDSSTCIQMLGVEETQSFAVSMETKSDIKDDHMLFQFAFRYSNIYQAEVSRVSTIRLPTTDNLSAYLASVQPEVATVLMAKKTLLLARTSSDALDMRVAVDERVKDIAVKFGSVPGKSKLHQFPKELSTLPENLFHLRRGPLLGSIIGHEDERSVLRNIFLNASFDLSLRMIAPRCLMHREGGTFEELPAYDLAMQSDAAVVLDHGTDVFIWLGAELATQEAKSAAALAACRTLAEELTEQRFPAPRILAFKEGSSQARYFVSRLIPAHKDPPYEQEARFPQLHTLSREQREKLKSSFLHFDDFSFCEWMRSLKLVPPEPS
ncbi:protein transport protein SEC23 [Amborella trichopoda]|uniref:Protein transport protein SEC23 n=1 Tax=Amborella trichopoda TaxID=13333 RepID=W1PM81_AMBTC|nr:protein transport protein SEC23 [Amborella trichopoda]ERN11132.1 hypothetical protein AMTR_s00024p00173280 [Amborella trichopoda]|eukprot:XP_006849551.1 protein transport protein SEC23 [Amborella trichopoda]